MKAYKTEQLRNVGVFSHGGAGKTSLSEAMLFDAKAISRLGRVDEGTTASDYDPDEIKRHISVNATLLPLEWRDSKINLIDTPGYADFVGEVKSGMRVVDAALILLEAAAGVEVGTEQVWSYADELKLSRLLFVNKMERENANFDKAIEQARERLGNSVVPLQMPMGSHTTFKGVIDLLQMKAYTYSGKPDGSFTEGEVPADLMDQANKYREQLVEKASETDDELILKYLDGETLTNEELSGGILKGVRSGSLVPILCGSATANVGVAQLLDAIVSYLPSPADVPPMAGTNPANDQNLELSPDPSGPLAALVFKTLADPYVGKLTYFRVYSGTFFSDSQVLNANKNHEERVGQLYLTRGKEQTPVKQVDAGDFGAVAKLQETTTGETLCQPGRPVVVEGIHFPAPMFSAAIFPKTKADLDKMSTSITRLVEEDPSIRVAKDVETGETILSGIGESHIQITLDKLKRKFAVEVTSELPTVPYRETITTLTKSEYKHKKQTGGHGQYGHVYLELEPLPDGDFEFADRIVGGVVPKQYIPAVEKGVREALSEGFLAGYPVVHVRVTLFDGSYHTVDSSEMAFKIAAAQAFKKGAQAANPKILEPVMTLEITVPDQFTGDIMSDLNSRRARVLGMQPAGNGQTTIQAHAPLAEVQRYATDLRSITQARGSFKMEFDHYEEVPAHLTTAIIQAAKDRAEKEAKGS